MTYRSLLVVLFLASGCELWAQDAWGRAEQNIRRLPPDSFPGLPEPVSREMNRLGCVVPQSGEMDRPHNVITGRFASPTQVDWAFLCSTEGASSIEVVWGGDRRCNPSVSPIADRNFLQALGGGVIAFSRRLIPVERNRLDSYATELEKSSLADVQHQGIADYFEGKGSTVLLCVDGSWITLSGGWEPDNATNRRASPARTTPRRRPGPG